MWGLVEPVSQRWCVIVVPGVWHRCRVWRGVAWRRAPHSFECVRVYEAVCMTARVHVFRVGGWHVCVCGPENQVTIAAAGGIERVVAAMAGHAGSAGVQEAGCGALWNLSVNAGA